MIRKKHAITAFFFSSRRRHTRSKRDRSSDVCSSDLGYSNARDFVDLVDAVLHYCIRPLIGASAPGHHGYQRARSEERRVGKECRSRGSTHYEKETKVEADCAGAADDNTSQRTTCGWR